MVVFEGFVQFSSYREIISNPQSQWLPPKGGLPGAGSYKSLQKETAILINLTILMTHFQILIQNRIIRPK